MISHSQLHLSLTHSHTSHSQLAPLTHITDGTLTHSQLQLSRTLTAGTLTHSLSAAAVTLTDSQLHLARRRAQHHPGAGHEGVQPQQHPGRAVRGALGARRAEVQPRLKRRELSHQHGRASHGHRVCPARQHHLQPGRGAVHALQPLRFAPCAHHQHAAVGQRLLPALAKRIHQPGKWVPLLLPLLRLLLPFSSCRCCGALQREPRRYRRRTIDDGGGSASV
mmetsp:Transcript_40718/g.100603  ORF Transcript_40718/g.100603 Transcript_40718/m.100603 type:complete len:222 (+) Transcript_40718:170-835(+)